MKNKILLVEDDDIILIAIKFFLEGKNYEVLTANNGKSALEIYNTQPVLVVITDLRMPIMDGIALVDNLLSFPNKPVILVHSSAADMQNVIELMRKGVHDYLPKPPNFSELILKVNKAYEVAELRIIKENMEKERQVRISHMLNWNEWKEGILKRDQDKVDGNLIGSIRTSFSQGTGLGSLLSVIGRIQKKANEQEDCFEVSKPMMNFLFENASNARHVITVLEEIDKIQSSEMKLEWITISELHGLIATISEKMYEFEKLKDIKISLCENQFLHYPQKIGIHKLYFEQVISELLFNAFKFSKPKSKIYILIELKKSKMFISILNSPEVDASGIYGILPEYGNIIFEPFFRISKLVFESIPTLDFGLGLTMVDKIIRKHQGQIKAFNLISYLGLDVSEKLDTLLNFEIELPVKE